MATVVRVVDETTRGDRTNELTLEFLDERVTVREIIRGRVYQEVTEYNARQAGQRGYFRGLVQLTEAEQTLNGYRLRAARRIDWKQQVDHARKAFAANGLLLLVDDRQLTDLDEEVTLRHDSTVTFLKLVPLVGG